MGRPSKFEFTQLRVLAMVRAMGTFWDVYRYLRRSGYNPLCSFVNSF